MKRTTIIGAWFCLLVAFRLNEANAQIIPFDSVYQHAEGILKEQPRKSKRWMASYRELGVPSKDNLRMECSEGPDGYVIICNFRFKANYDALLRAVPTDAYGPEKMAYGTSAYDIWFLPERRLKIELGHSGKVATNGNADYRYTVMPMTTVEAAGFYVDDEGHWQRFMVESPFVGIEKDCCFYSSRRTLKKSVLSAGALVPYVISVEGLSIVIDARIPRKELPVIGKVYAAPAGCTAFPYGFVGKVEKVTLQGKVCSVEFVPVSELELFEVK